MEETPSFCNYRKCRRQHIDGCSLIQNSISINAQVSAKTLKSYSGIGKNKGGAEREAESNLVQIQNAMDFFKEIRSL